MYVLHKIHIYTLQTHILIYIYAQACAHTLALVTGVPEIEEVPIIHD